MEKKQDTKLRRKEKTKFKKQKNLDLAASVNHMEISISWLIFMISQLVNTNRSTNPVYY